MDHTNSAVGLPALPLAGFRVGITAERRAREQSEMFLRRGAKVVLAPLVETVPLAPGAGLRTATEAIVREPPDVLVANTAVGIRTWFAAAESWGLGDALLDALGDTRILARGPKGAGAILTAGLTVDWRAPSETLHEVVAEILSEPVRGRRIALQCDGDRRQPEIDVLLEAGADVVELRVYAWNLPSDPDPARRLLGAACAGRVDALTFTSAAAVANLFALADEAGSTDSLRRALNGPVVAMCVGPVCGDALAARGATAVLPERARLGAMVHRLTEELSARRRTVSLAGVAAVVQGSVVLVDGQEVTLSDRESDVLAILLERNGAVVPRAELMRRVWGAGRDEHALEATITRLRARLGPAGRAVRTVVRRGYRVELD